MKTFSAKAAEVDRKWWIIDARDQVLGRVAVKAANLLRGKEKALVTPHVDTGDFVVVINADKVRLTGKKEEQKTFMSFSGFVGGHKSENVRARIRLTPGNGKIDVNGKSFEDYFPTVPLQNTVLQPLQVVKLANAYDISVNTTGGGATGQAGAARLAISRALLQVDANLRGTLKAEGLLRRDPRMKERKKSGQPGARKRFQFSKR